MIEEPYRWVEAIANRREYIETQLASGSPIVALSCADGILFLTASRGRQKIFEIYDRIAMGAIGHPGDIERLRLAAIELASTEGFTRSTADVSLRRLVHYSLSPAMKAAFEQVYGAPYLARLVFGEIGATPNDDLLLRVDYDGAISTNKGNTNFIVISGPSDATAMMETFLRREHNASASLHDAIERALDAWAVAQLADTEDKELPSRERIEAMRAEHLSDRQIEAALLERNDARAIRFRTLPQTATAALARA